MANEIKAFIYYQVQDNAFQRAARWEASQADQSFNYEFIGVRTKQDFISAWNGILTQAQFNMSLVQSVSLYTHATKQMDDLDGLEFSDGPGGTTLTRGDIQALAQLPWTQNGFIGLNGCNTGLTGPRGWCPAETFANSQNIMACGETGFAYFSSDELVYQEIKDTDKEVYLHAYRRRRNGPGTGHQIPGTCFHIGPLFVKELRASKTKPNQHHPLFKQVLEFQANNRPPAPRRPLGATEGGEFTLVSANFYAVPFADTAKIDTNGSIFVEFQGQLLEVTHIQPEICLALLSPALAGRKFALRWSDRGPGANGGFTALFESLSIG